MPPKSETPSHEHAPTNETLTSVVNFLQECTQKLQEGFTEKTQELAEFLGDMAENLPDIGDTKFKQQAIRTFSSSCLALAMLTSDTGVQKPHESLDQPLSSGQPAITETVSSTPETIPSIVYDITSPTRAELPSAVETSTNKTLVVLVFGSDIYGLGPESMRDVANTIADTQGLSITAELDNYYLVGYRTSGENPNQYDLNGDGTSDIDVDMTGFTTDAQAEAAIAPVLDEIVERVNAGEASNVVFYALTHGDPSLEMQMDFSPYVRVKEATLENFANRLPSSATVSFIFEECYSGNSIFGRNDLSDSNENVVTVTSAGPLEVAWANVLYGHNYFFPEALSGVSFNEAFEQTAAPFAGPNENRQTPHFQASDFSPTILPTSSRGGFTQTVGGANIGLESALIENNNDSVDVRNLTAETKTYTVSVESSPGVTISVPSNILEVAPFDTSTFYIAPELSPEITTTQYITALMKLWNTQEITATPLSLPLELSNVATCLKVDVSQLTPVQDESGRYFLELPILNSCDSDIYTSIVANNVMTQAHTNPDMTGFIEAQGGVSSNKKALLAQSVSTITLPIDVSFEQYWNDTIVKAPDVYLAIYGDMAAYNNDAKLRDFVLEWKLPGPPKIFLPFVRR